MRWHDDLCSSLNADWWSERTIKKYAWNPTLVLSNSGYVYVWLEPYYEIQQCIPGLGWVSQESYSREQICE